jgi:hypothetical protein
VRPEVQPASGASTSVKTSTSIPAVTPTAPATSKRRAGRGVALSLGTSFRAAIRTRSASGAGNRNTQRHPISVSTPLKTRPSENPMAPVAV